MAGSDFVTQFHNLDGILVSEKRKKLFKLMRNKKLLENKQELFKSFENIKPRSHLENLFKVEVLIYFKQTSALLDILKSANEILISKIIKEKWFFGEAFKEISAQDLVNNYLPLMSYSVRMKVLRQLMKSLPEHQMDEIYEEVLNRYGLFIALNLISSCSCKKIEEILTNNEVRLFPSQVKIIYDKNPQLAILYFEESKRKFGLIHDMDSICKYIAIKDPQFFLTLKEKFNPSVALGRRTTKKIVDIKRQDIISNPNKYASILKTATLVRKLQGDFNQFYSKIFPKSKYKVKSEGNYALMKYLKCCSKNRRFPLHAETFHKVLGNSIWDNLDCVNEDLLNFVTNVEMRHKLAELKFLETKNIAFVKYYKSQDAISIIKQKINLTSNIHDRSNLVYLLVDTCRINDDYNALEDVLKYFCTRHRNDDITTKVLFLEYVRKMDLKKFNETHWKYINEIIRILTAKQGFIWGMSVLSYFYIEFVHKSGQNIDEAVLEYMKTSPATRCHGSTWYTNYDNADIERLVLLKVRENLPSFVKKDFEDFDTRLGFDIINFNIENPDKAISFMDYPRFFKSLKSVFTKEYLTYNHNFKISMKYFICKQDRNEIEESLLKQYFENYEHISDKKIFHWFLKYEPNTLLNYFDKFILACIKCNMNIYNEMKNYTHIKFDEKVVEFCKKQITNSEFENHSNCIKPLSILMPYENYLKFIEQYYPTTKKVDLENEEEKALFDLQCTVAKSLKRIINVDVIPSVLKYCVGDYLESALGSLNLIFYRLPENSLHDVIEELSKRAVSVRKHSFFLACCVLDKASVLTLLKNVGANENNKSIQKQLFKAVLKYFRKNPSDEIYNLCKIYMQCLDKADEESIAVLLTFKYPKKYKPLFIQDIWALFEDFENDGENMQENKNSVLGLVDEEIIKELPLKFCNEIIKLCFLKLNTENCCINEFVTTYLINRPEYEDNFNSVFEIIENFKTLHHTESKKIIFEFVEVFRARIYSYKKDHETSIILFNKHWHNHFTPLEAFREHLALKMLLIRYSEQDTDNLAASILKFTESLVEDFGLFVLDEIVSALDECLDLTVPNLYKFYLSLLKCKTDRLNYIFVLKLKTLHTCSSSHDQESTDDYAEVLRLLSECTDKQVQVHYNLYWRKLSIL